MSRLRIQPLTRPLHGSVPVPCDRLIAERQLLLAALSRGTCQIRGASLVSRVEPLLAALSSLGVEVSAAEATELTVHGRGLWWPGGHRQGAYAGDAATFGLLASVLAPQHFETSLELTLRRPTAALERVLDALQGRGAHIAGAEDGHRLVLRGPDERLLPIDHALPTTDVELKSCLLLSGLFANGATLVQESVMAADHTERLLSALSLPVESLGTAVRLHPPADANAIAAFDSVVPGDFSCAAVLLGAAALVPGSVVTTRGTGLNPTRTGWLDALRWMGGNTGLTPHGSALGEPIGEVTVQHHPLRARELGGEILARASADVAMLVALMARARGVSTLHEMAQLSEPERERAPRLITVLDAFGVPARLGHDELTVQGDPERPLRAAVVDGRGDANLVLLASLLGLVADGVTVVDGAEELGPAFPRFAGTLRALGASIEVET